jgi:hypothetical protein
LYRLSYGISSSFAHPSHCRQLNSAHADSSNGARPGWKKLLPLLGGKDLAAVELQVNCDGHSPRVITNET